MILYKDGKFRIGSVAITLPDNIYLETEPGSLCEFGFELVSSDEQFRIIIGGSMEDEEVGEYLDRTLLEGGFTIVKKRERYTNDSLNGWCVHYESKKNMYVEFAFGLPETDRVNFLDIFIEADKQADMEEIVASRVVQDLLKGITVI